MNKTVKIKAPAKINLYLDITGRNENGYHDLSSVMQSLDLFDYVEISVSEGSGISLDCPVPVQKEENIAYKAARAFMNAIGKDFAADIKIEKNIPSEAGLAGGSADAAAVLYGLDMIFEHPLGEEKLLEIGSGLGADVPFMIKGGTMLCEGIGDRFTALSPLPYEAWIVLAKPSFGMSTKESYAYYDEHLTGEKASCSVGEIVSALEMQDLASVSGSLYNVLEKTVQNEEIAAIENIMKKHGALGSSMTGSGTCVFGIFEDENCAISASDELATGYEFVSINRPVSYGACEDKSFKVTSRLDELGISYERIDHPSVYTMEEMYALGIFGKGIVGKNLFIRDSKGKRHFLIFVYGDKKADLSGIQDQLGIKHVSFGSAERLYEHLGLTKGSVSPMGVVNNDNADVEFIIDRDFIGCPCVGVHPNQNTSTLWMSFSDIEKLIRSNGNSITYINI